MEVLSSLHGGKFNILGTLITLFQVTDDEVDEMIRMVDKDGDGQVKADATLYTPTALAM